METPVHMGVGERRRRMRAMLRKMTTQDIWWPSPLLALLRGEEVARGA